MLRGWFFQGELTASDAWHDANLKLKDLDADNRYRLVHAL